MQRFAILGAALTLAACSSPGSRPLPYVSETMRAGLGTIAIVSAPAQAPDDVPTPPGQVRAILEGPLRGTLDGLGQAVGSGDPVAAAILALLTPISTVRGTIEGFRVAESAEARERAVAGVEAGLLSARLEPSLAERISHYARAELGDRIVARLRPQIAYDDASACECEGIDTLFQVGDAVVRLSSDGGDRADPVLRLRIESQARLVRASDGKVLYQHTRGWGLGERHALSTWGQDGGRLLQQGIERTRRILSRKIVEHVLLVYHDERTQVSEERSEFPIVPPGRRLVWGLAPVEPPVLSTPAQAKSLQPSLAWQPFPGRVEIPQESGHGPPTVVPFVPVDLARVREVTYEIQIREGGRVIYQRRGLPQPRHRVERPLDPATTYRWAIRAWFELEGEKRASEWSQLLYREDEITYAAGWRGFFFKTPPAE